MTPGLKLSAARYVAREKQPWFTAALYALVAVECRDLDAKTLAVTERGVLLWYPPYVEKTDLQELAVALLHEVSHVLRDHARRCRSLSADPVLWNLAADAELNDDLKAAGLAVGATWVYPSTLGQSDGRCAEEYYRAIEKKAQERTKDGTVGGGWCGGGSGGRRSAQEPKDAAGRDLGWTEARTEHIKRQVAEAVKSEATGKQAGRVPGNWLVWANQTLAPPKVSWRQKLPRLVRSATSFQAGKVDLTWTRPSRRQAGLGYGPGVPVLPALHAPVPRVWFVADTSGSMTPDLMRRVMSEAAGVLRAVGGCVTFLSCDAAVHAVREVRTVQEAIRELRGGGGTDFRPVFAEVARSRSKPTAVVFATDGYGPAPETPPVGCRVVWLLVGRQVVRPAPWGEEVRVDDDGE